jgi:hypothetical protein
VRFLNAKLLLPMKIFVPWMDRAAAGFGLAVVAS